MDGMRSGSDNPCRGCTDRYPGCHDRCPDRKVWVEEHERIRRAEREYREGWVYTAIAVKKNRRKR